MADLITRDLVYGIEEEVTEGTYVAPQSTGGYFQPLEGEEFTPSRELLERNILSGSIGRSAPKLGMKSAQLSIPVEFRASGTEGAAPDFDKLIESAMGAVRSIASQVTTKNASHTTTQLEIEDADISDFSVGDIIVVLKSGAHEARAVTAVDTTGSAANITIAPALSSTPPNSVVIAKARTYYLADTGHPSLSLSRYVGAAIRQAALGCKVSQMSFDNFATGQIASLNFALQAMSFTETVGAPPHTPVYDSAAPPVILNTCIWKGSSMLSMNNFSLQLQNELVQKKDFCDANGVVAQLVARRTISGTMNPYAPHNAVTQFDNWLAGTQFSMFGYAYTPSATSGEIELGSVVGFYLPACIVTEYKKTDQDGLVIDEMAWQATRGNDGTTPEFYLGMI